MTEQPTPTPNKHQSAVFMKSYNKMTFFHNKMTFFYIPMTKSDMWSDDKLS